MRAVTIRAGTILVDEHPDPRPGDRELLVAVRAAGLNRADLRQRDGFYPAPPGSPPDIPGLEFAGEVVGVGRGATRFAIGDRVMGIVGGGAQAELVVIHERHAMPVPGPLDWAAAGAAPEAFTTAHDALFTQAGLQAGERLLVHGAAGGVGTAAVQLGVAAGARVTATVRGAIVRPQVAALGPHAVIGPSQFVAAGPYDVILELVGATNVRDDLAALDHGGRIVMIGVGSGTTARLDLLQLMVKRARVMGSTLRSRSLEEKAAAAGLMARHVLPLFEIGTLHVPITATFDLEHAPGAYTRFEVGAKFGKVVVTTAGRPQP